MKVHLSRSPSAPFIHQRRSLAALVLALAAVPGLAAQGEGGMAANWKVASVPNGFTLTAVGDLIITEAIYPKLKRESPELVKLLQGSDVTFGNFEDTAIDLRKFGGYPEALSGGGWLRSSPRVPQDLRAMGFNLVGRANNHTTDWGVAGMRYTNGLLDQAGIIHAGTGDTLAEARAAQILNVAAGRVALVSIASRFEANARAVDPLGQIPGRPGVNALRCTRYVLVSPGHLAALAKVRDAQPKGSVRDSVLASDAKTGGVTLFDTRYRARADLGDGSMDFSYAMNERDRKEIVRAIRQGKQTSDFAIATIHTHEPGNYSDAPPDFLQVLAREAIDNGADAFIGHGPHQLRGIEIYNGKPIFYSLGNFFFMDNTLQPVTRDEFEKDNVEPTSMTEAEFMEHRRVHGVFKDRIWFESVVATSRFDERGNVKEIRLHPIELHWNAGRDADRGIPRLAPPDVAKRVLDQLVKLSQPYGTKIEIQNNIGIIKL
jgi:poly-gamma-glutamate synthesis protein (capsule biosynthesis protein)